MLNALQSDRANPRWRPPHMASAGLWSRPTVINNVESLCCVPGIVRLGAERWRDLGLTDEGGTRICGVSGRARQTGAWELPVGTPLREMIEHARRRHARRLQAARRAARRRLDALHPGGRHRHPDGLRPHEEGRLRPGHRHGTARRRLGLPGRPLPQPAALLRPGVVRLVHALLGGPALGRLGAERHRRGPRTPRAPRPARRAVLVHGRGDVLLRPRAERHQAARHRPEAVPRRLRAAHRRGPLQLPARRSRRRPGAGRAAGRRRPQGGGRPAPAAPRRPGGLPGLAPERAR